jgi:hypothetical protein
MLRDTAGARAEKEFSKRPHPLATRRDRGCQAILAWANFAELRAVSATWLRGFFPRPDADLGALAGRPVIRTLLAAGTRNYRTVLSPTAFERRVAGRHRQGGHSGHRQRTLHRIPRL